MRYMIAILGGAAVGAGAALLFAPKTGSATRSMIKDKATKVSNDVQDFVQSKSQHFKNKMTGMKHEAASMMEQNSDIMDTGRDLIDRTKDLIDTGRDAYEKVVSAATGSGSSGTSSAVDQPATATIM